MQKEIEENIFENLVSMVFIINVNELFKLLMISTQNNNNN